MTTTPALFPADGGGGKARYLMVGGFLGAGKTTAILKLAAWLTRRKRRVGLISNDQGTGLVDTKMMRAQGFAAEEIAGGCFCCRFNSLVEAAGRLTAATRPDVLVAEPVGSCTDLVATVSYPLRRIYGAAFSIAPLSVLLDPIRAERIFGLQPGANFSEKVLYIYRKQLQEADLLVLGKADLLDNARTEALAERLTAEFPRAEVLKVSARTGAGLEEWFERIVDAEQTARETTEIDYDVYAEGEALLGWLNCTVALKSNLAFDGDELIRALAEATQRRLKEAGVEIAHLKMTLSPNGGLGHLAVVNVVRNDFIPELAQSIEDAMESGQLIINLRGEGAPEQLRAAVDASLTEVTTARPGVDATIDHLEHFRPGRPTPTHRVAEGAAVG